MSAEEPLGTPSGSSADSPKTSDLSGLTEAIGGLEPAVPDRDPLIGSVIGEVTIIRLIAEGGMGRVYEGLQSKPQRSVAVKVMRPGFVSRDARRRFDLESEVLGRLRHQYIAQIYSAGMCNIVGAQVPYFVMEFIPDAMPLTKFASEKKLSTDERIELFRKVCEAVAHGHEKGIVHRDLKPSNILVEPSGTPQIIDFGVARCIDASADAQTNVTDMGQLIGTLQYMSPEQLDASPNAIDKRADVYALGVILYELLTGKPPYEISRKEIFEAARVIREQKPLSPSRLNQNVQPDVVRITGRCLQKDRRKRYNNAAELAHALGEYLGGRSVPDSSPSPFKGSRRRLGLLLVAGAMTTLAAILVGAYLMPGRTARHSGQSSSLVRPQIVPPTKDRTELKPGQGIDGENARSGHPNAVAVGVGEIRGTCMLNGHPFLTTDTPVLSSLSWLEDGKQNAIKNARFTYESATGKYSLAGLPPKNYILMWLYFHRHPEDALHLGGQYLFSAYHIDLQGKTDAERADFPLLVEQVIHLKKPVDNSGILEKTAEGLHPELSSPVTFEWEPVEGADAYEVEVSTWLHKGHPTGVRPTPIWQKTSDASASFSLDATKDKEWYRVNIKAFDQGRQVAELMKVSPGSYGEWIDFVVRP